VYLIKLNTSEILIAGREANFNPRILQAVKEKSKGKVHMDKSLD
jgi:hypothetical protein